MDSYSLARPILFALDAERAHNWGISLLRFAPKISAEPMPVRTRLGELANPLGLAAGYDKTGKHIHELARLGFGYISAGTFTISPWPGNPKPRVARNVKEKALVNALGFPNPGIDEFIRNVSRLGARAPPIVASISGRTAEDILGCYRKVQGHVAGVELNLSSPNTAKLVDLREPSAFSQLAESLKQAKAKPTYLKVPPYQNETSFESTLAMVRRWESLGFEGVTASNSVPITDARMAIGTGGYSGPPLFEKTKAAVESIRRSVSEQFEVNAVGGVSGAADVAELLKLGATTVQVFTALVYQGPSLMKRMLTDSATRQVVAERSSKRP
ncbi:MAG: hypothetical protein OK455_05005 [Thaumarchaeota archaeon]|nr:hypothetical protein [Nitrososphaerota archaeon]